MKNLILSIISIYRNKIFFLLLRKLLFSKHLEKVFSSDYFSTFVRPKILEISKKSRILIIAPHPDDEVIGMGGALMKEIKDL